MTSLQLATASDSAAMSVLLQDGVFICIFYVVSLNPEAKCKFKVFLSLALVMHNTCIFVALSLLCQARDVGALEIERGETFFMWEFL